MVNHFDEQGIPLVSYMIRSSISDSEWVFPQKAEILKTNSEQIIARKVPVDYKCSACIRCGIKSDDLLSTLNLKMKELNDAIANQIDIC